jgi:WD40 repeat protein
MAPMPPLPALLLTAALFLPLRTDHHGDPLPPGAVARLGSLRLYHGGGEVEQVIFSPDGKLLASQNASGCRLWDPVTGRELPAREEIQRAARFLAVQGKLLAAECSESGVRLWDAATGRLVRRLEVDLRNTVFGMSPDGQTLVWATRIQGRDRSHLHFCDTSTGVVSEPAGRGEIAQVTQLVFSADSRTLAVLAWHGYVDLWDLPGRRIRRSLATRSVIMNEELRIALSPDGNSVAGIGMVDRDMIARSHVETVPHIQLWDTRTGKALPRLEHEPTNPLKSLAFSPDGKRLAASGPEPRVRVWDLATFRVCREMREQDWHSRGSLAFSPDGTRLAGADGSTLLLWDVATGQPCHDFGHPTGIDALRFTPDGHTLFTGLRCQSGAVICRWDLLRETRTGLWRGGSSLTQLMVISPDAHVAAWEDGGRSWLWTFGTGNAPQLLGEQGEFACAPCFSPDGKTLAAGRGKKAVRLFDATTGREVRAFGASLSPGGDRAIQQAFSPDGKLLAVPVGVVRLWDVAAGKELGRLSGRSPGASLLAFSPDGRTLATGGAGRMVQLWDVASRRAGREILIAGEPSSKRPEGIGMLQFSPDGRMLAVGIGLRRPVRFVEVASGQERAGLEGHREPVRCGTFSPDGRVFASGSFDRTVLVWDTTGQETAAGGDLGTAGQAALWDALASSDAHVAYQAMRRLGGLGDRAVPGLRERLLPVGEGEARQVARLVAALDDARFAVREEATRALVNLGSLAEPALRMALSGRPSAELRRRAEVILRQLDPAASPIRLRELRAVEVLEWMGTAAARRLLQTLAKGVAEARLTTEAQASLDRLAKRH